MLTILILHKYYKFILIISIVKLDKGIIQVNFYIYKKYYRITFILFFKFCMTQFFCIYPGQGSQFVGMGKDIAGSFQEARVVFEELDDALSENLSDVIFFDKESTLDITRNTQPAIMAVSIAIIAVLKKELGSDFLERYIKISAGHSLGEYTAICALGMISFPDVARLLRLRGIAMQNAMPVGMGGMLAIISSNIGKVRSFIEESVDIEIANDNNNGQIVIGGTISALEEFKLKYSKESMKMIPLKVSAAFHTRFMNKASDELEIALSTIKGKDINIPIISNVTVEECIKWNIEKKLLVEQVSSMVRWRETISYVSHVDSPYKNLIHLEIGTGSGVLNKMTKRYYQDATVMNISDLKSLNEFLHYMNQGS